ncbi:DUF6894 family protein [Microvirga ossetica]|uniref:DUF6894 family protein n=1 Tax=Microvirga ossetica TaxID=1882682 RepID=UPI00130002E3|nr:hypothetical protein [Microvirga ossetica]
MHSRFYFHLTNGEDVIGDEVGALAFDIHAAVNYALEAIEQLRAEDPSAVAEWFGWRLEITDETGRIIRDPLPRRPGLEDLLATIAGQTKPGSREIVPVTPLVPPPSKPGQSQGSDRCGQAKSFRRDPKSGSAAARFRENPNGGLTENNSGLVHAIG